MSRTLSPACVAAILAPETDDDIIILLTITGVVLAEPIRIANSHTTRLSETADNVVYGVMSGGLPYVYLPVSIILPQEDDAAPRATLEIQDVTREVIPLLRSLTGPPVVDIALVLRSSPDVVEATFPGFRLAQVPYSQDTLTAELTVESDATEPFPCFSFTPSYFPGMF